MNLRMLRRCGAITAVIAAGMISEHDARADDPTKAQCIDANASAQDLRRAGKLRDARARLAVCLAQSCPGAIREDCESIRKDVEAQMPSLIFEAKDGAGNDVSAARVTIDGRPFAERLDGKAVDVDPGEHVFAFDAQALPRVEKTIVVRVREKDRRVSIVLGAAKREPDKGDPPVSADDRNPVGSTQRTVGLVLGGAGVVGLVFGGVFGLVSKSTYDRALKTSCNGSPTSCNDQGVTDGQTAHSQATISTIGFVAGGVLLAGGALLYFTAPKAGDVAIAPTVGTQGAGLSIRGAWW